MSVHSLARSALSVLLPALVLAAAAPAQAAGLGFLGRSTLAHLNERDIDLARGALGRALTTSQLEVAQTWRNPDTRAGGEITPLRSFEQDGRPCRELKIDTRHPKARSQGVYTLCRAGERWVVATPAAR